MAKVKMLTNTNYKGIVRRKGKIYEDVEHVTAVRWQRNNIAIIIEEAEATGNAAEETTTTIKEDIETDETAKIEFDKMTAKELYKFAQEQGFDVEAKKPKEYYLEILQA